MKPNMFPNGTEKGGGGGLKLRRTETLTVVHRTMRRSQCSYWKLMCVTYSFIMFCIGDYFVKKVKNVPFF